MFCRVHGSPHRAGEGAVLDAVHADGDDAERLEAVVVAHGGDDDEIVALALVVGHALGEGQRIDVLRVEDLMGVEDTQHQTRNTRPGQAHANSLLSGGGCISFEHRGACPTGVFVSPRIPRTTMELNDARRYVGSSTPNPISSRTRIG